MALGSYSDLKSEIANWMMGRTDLAPDVDTFIDLAEADFNRIIRTRQMEKSATLTPNGNSEVTLPADYLEWRTVTLLANPRESLRYITPDQMEEMFGDRTSGCPRFFTLRGDTMTILPPGGSDVRIDYYGKIPALSDSNTTNWLLTCYPNVYLFQCLKYAGIFIRDQDSAAMYGALANGALEALSTDDSRARYASIAQRVVGPTP